MQLDVSCSFNEATNVNFCKVSDCSFSPSLCVLYGSFEIRHTLSINSPYFSLRNQFFPVGRRLLGVTFFLCFKQWFQWDQFEYIMSVPLFFRKAALLWLQWGWFFFFHLWLLTLQNFFKILVSHILLQIPCGLQSLSLASLFVDGTLYDAMLKEFAQNIGSLLSMYC